MTTVYKPEIKIFNESDLIILQQSQRRKYENRGRFGDFGTVPHWGQRKLLLNEIEFLTNHWDPKLIPNPICIYAGAAVGTHITLLSTMFPAFTFYLYDPSPFSITENDKIKIFTGEEKGFFTDTVAESFANRKDVFFISDIRTSDWKKNLNTAFTKYGITEFDEFNQPIGDNDIIQQARDEASPVTEEEVWSDMQAQQRWVQIMNPEHALLKFRLPWPNDGVDKQFKYLKGIIYWQPWAPHTSTETRLKPVKDSSGKYELVNYSILTYEQQCFYHNTVSRELVHYKNIFTGTDEPIDFPELLNDYDSTAEAMILKQYFRKQGVKDINQSYTIVKQLSRTITSILNFNDLEKETSTTLCILRSTPYKASGRATSAKRIAWFKEHPEEFVKCQNQYKGIQEITPKPMASTRPVFNIKPERKTEPKVSRNPKTNQTIQGKVSKPQTSLRATATEFSISETNYKLPSIPNFVKQVTTPLYAPIKINYVNPIVVNPP